MTSDGGEEFANAELKQFLAAKGIQFIPSHDYVPEENALVEKHNGVLVSKIRAAYHAAVLPTKECPEVLRYNFDIDDRTASRIRLGHDWI